MDQDREQERQRYVLCRIGFGLLSVALGVACFTTVVMLPRQFGGRAFFPWLIHTGLWHWSDVPVVWASLLGTYFLWGRWDQPAWQRRTGLLMVYCLVDVGLWFLDHGNELGMRIDDFGHEWLRNQLGQALGWAEFALLAGLASDYLVHLGVDQAAETGKATRSLAATGSVLWLLLFLQRADWRRWPLNPRRAASLETLLLHLGSTMIWTIALIQVTALVFAAARQGSALLDEMKREEESQDTLRSRSESTPLSDLELGAAPDPARRGGF